MQFRIVICLICIVSCVPASASIDASWGKVEACNYEKNKTQKLLKDFNHISDELSKKHASGAAGYSELEEILTAVFVPFSGPLTMDMFRKTVRCSAQMKIAVLKYSVSNIKGYDDSWLMCYKHLYPKEHAVIKATQQVDSCLRKTN